MVVGLLRVVRCAVAGGRVAHSAVVSGRVVRFHPVSGAQVALCVQDVIFQSCTLRDVVVVQRLAFQELRTRCALRCGE